MRVIVAGATGRTGAPVAAGIAQADGLELVARVAPSLAGSAGASFGTLSEAIAAVEADVLVDFTQPQHAEQHALLAIEQGLDLVLGTSGLAAPQRARIDRVAREAGRRAFYGPNFALGAVLAMRFAEQAAALFPRAEIVELHSEHKLDAPSGTAAVTAERIEAITGAEVPIHSVRLPGLIAHQETLFGGDGQLLTIRHDTTSREAFVPGVLLALRGLARLPAGLTVGLEALLDQQSPAS